MATHGALSLSAVFRPLTSYTSVTGDLEDIQTPQTAPNTIETGHVISPRWDTTCWSLQKAMIISQLALQDAREVKLINNITWSDIECLMYLRTTDWSAVENRSVLHCVVKEVCEVSNYFFFLVCTHTPKAIRLQQTLCCPTLKTFQYSMDAAPPQKCTLSQTHSNTL